MKLTALAPEVLVGSVFGAYLGGIETLELHDLWATQPKFGAYLRGIETVVKPFWGVWRNLFGAYLGGIETRVAEAGERPRHRVWSLPRRD